MTDRSPFDLTGRKSLVTGGAMGIGRGCVLALARAGADVAVADLDEATGVGTVAAAKALGVDAMFVRCNVAHAGEVEAMVSAVVERFGRLDVAVNNAGIYRHALDEEQAEEDWEQVIGVNLTGTWRCARAEMQQMARQEPAGGKIVNIASIAAGHIVSNGSYDASKAGVVQLTRTLAVQWGRYNINVNSISPGYVISALGTTRSLEERDRLRELTPLGHVERVEDLAGPLVFLASRASDYVTGQNVVVDGGHTLSTWHIPLPERAVPPRIDAGDEVLAMNSDLDDRGVPHDAHGIIAADE
jgi:NAD(P)-dependent dehydrogenase (short-subunit alcohol dehydrogenase family)